MVPATSQKMWALPAAWLEEGVSPLLMWAVPEAFEVAKVESRKYKECHCSARATILLQAYHTIRTPDLMLSTHLLT